MLTYLRKAVRCLLPSPWRVRLSRVTRLEERVTLLEQRNAIALREALRGAYPKLAAPEERVAHAPVNRHEARLFSQNNEDGILFHLFDRLGVTDRRFVEFGIGAGLECNSAALALVFGWRGLLMDCNPHGIAFAQTFLRRSLGKRPFALRLLQRTVTPDTINPILEAEGYAGEFDLLSVDIDSNDYHVWKAVEAARPRVVVSEYNASFGPERSLTIPYTPGFDRHEHHPRGWYFGASLAALTRLGHRKGYVLAGCDSAGVNAFFVRSDVAAGIIDPVAPADAFYPNSGREPVMSTEAQFDSFRHLPLVEITESGAERPWTNSP